MRSIWACVSVALYLAKRGGVLSSGALWSSGFRPLYLLAALYGALLMVIALMVFSGGLLLPSSLPFFLWHGHELLFGFAVAIASGFILTALPSWAGSEEIKGGRLKWIVLLWLAGRLLFWFSPSMGVTAVVDSLYFVVLIGLIAPGLARVGDKRYLLLIPILLLFLCTNIWFYVGVLDGRADIAQQALRGSVYTLMILFSFVAGLLTPIFTHTHLQSDSWPESEIFIPAIEILAVISVVLFGFTGLFYAGTTISAGAALFAFLVHSVRMMRWRGWSIRGDSLLKVMHIAYIGFLLTFVARGAGDLSGKPDADLAIHLFTLGAFGLMKMSLMTRIAFKHTGREINPPRLIEIGFWMMVIAALMRLLAGLYLYKEILLLASGLLWSLCWLFYLFSFWKILIGPNLPRSS